MQSSGSSGSINGYNHSGQVISSSYGGGGGAPSALAPRSKTSGNLGAVDDDEEEEDEEELLIESSNLQLQGVMASLDALAAAPIPTASGSMDGQAPFFLAGSPGTGGQGGTPPIGAGSASGSAMGVSGIPGLPVLSSASTVGPLLSRTDTHELSEVISGSLDLLRSSITLRLEQNTLMKYIAAWLKRKYAIERLRME